MLKPEKLWSFDTLIGLRSRNDASRLSGNKGDCWVKGKFYTFNKVEGDFGWWFILVLKIFKLSKI